MIDPLEHAGLVAETARIYASRYRKFDRDDLFQVGFIGLMDACSKYEEQVATFGGRLIRFRTYAQHRIRGGILDYIRQSNLIHISRWELDKEDHRHPGILQFGVGDVMNEEDVVDHRTIPVSSANPHDRSCGLRVEAILAILDRRLARVIRMRYGICGPPLTIREIADDLGMHTNTVWRYLKKGVDISRKRFQNGKSLLELN